MKPQAPMPDDAGPIMELTLPKRPSELAAAALALGIAVDVLFDGHPLGISFPIWAGLAAGALLLGARQEGFRPNRSALIFVSAILFFTAIVSLRLEPMTVALSVVSTVMLFGLWVRSLRHGRMLRFGWFDFAAAWTAVPLESLLRPWATLGVATRRVTGDRAARSRGAAVLRGLLLALPMLVVLVALLAAADFVFRDLVEDALAWLDIEWIQELIGRSLVVAVSGLFSLGALVTALRERPPGELIGDKKPFLRPFLGFIETAVVLGAVDLVFAVFVAIQFRYLFGGEANITAAGYTYSDYARRGFSELVLAAFLNLGLILALGHWGRHEETHQRVAFDGLSASLVAMLAVTLASALMRLLLYENAYGFTRLRTYTHFFIFWLGALLVAFAVLLFRDRLRAFAPASVAAGFGFVATLGLINVDGFIAARNLDRLRETGDLDVPYLASLTGDAIPALTRSVDEPSPPDLLAHLACQRAVLETWLSESSWQSYHLGRQSAANSLAGIREFLEPYHVRQEQMSWYVEGPDGDEILCPGQWWN